MNYVKQPMRCAGDDTDARVTGGPVQTSFTPATELPYRVELIPLRDQEVIVDTNTIYDFATRMGASLDKSGYLKMNRHVLDHMTRFFGDVARFKAV